MGLIRRDQLQDSLPVCERLLIALQGRAQARIVGLGKNLLLSLVDAERISLTLKTVSEITEEDRRIRIGMIQLIPDVRPILLAQKIGDQSCFAGTCICGHQRYRQCQI